MVWSNKDYKVSILASSVVDREPWSGLTKTIKLAFAASPLSTQFSGARSKTDWLRIRLMCPSGGTCRQQELALINKVLVKYKADIIIMS
jgi:hypothetical protein